jgi:nicotinamidase-related amidase
MPEPDRAAHPTALLVIDMISRWDFPDAPALLPRALAIAPRIAELAARWRRDAKWPVVFANDNHGRWRSERTQLFEAAIDAGGDAARIARTLKPDDDDYFVIKPKHSAFHATPLALLLRHLAVRRVVPVGVTSDQCILATAADARMHEIDIVIARDAVEAPTPERLQASIRHFEDVLELPTYAADELPAALQRDRWRQPAAAADRWPCARASSRCATTRRRCRWRAPARCRP